MITVDDFLTFLDDALNAMVAIVIELGDEWSNRKPDLPGANSPYAILTHCLGVMEFWGGHAIAGREFERDRASEFVASGQVEDLVERARIARAKLGADLLVFEPEAHPRGVLTPKDQVLPLGRTQGGTLMHIYEELSQHLGQMEMCRDVLLAKWVRLA